MLWSIDSCQNRTSAGQYHLTVSRAQVSTHRGRVLFWSYPLTNYQFQMIAGLSLFFPMIHMKSVVFMSLWPRTVKILISNWPRTRIQNQSIPPARNPHPPLGLNPGTGICFGLGWQIPWGGDFWAVKSTGVGAKKKGKCPVLRQHCNIFHWSHIRIVPF